jgi:hypothetical protein
MLLRKSEALETKALSFFMMLERFNYPEQFSVRSSGFYPEQ